jgi:hypothetical protein
MSHILSGNASDLAVFWPAPWPIKPTAYISVNDPNRALSLVLFALLKNNFVIMRGLRRVAKANTEGRTEGRTPSRYNTHLLTP